MADIAAAIKEVKALIGDRLSTGQSDRDLHGANETYFTPVPPDAVAYPDTSSEVSEIVKICAKHGCPVVPWGVGTSLEGHALAVKGGISLDMSRMNRVVDILAEDQLATVQPGITRQELNTELRATGLFFPIDPGANATIGGMTATNASGTAAVRYGTMRNVVRRLEVVLADGRIIHTGTHAKKSSAGYDLTRLMVGSEGTLGIITEITLGLSAQPEEVAAAICSFPTIGAAVNTVIEIIQMGIEIGRVELLDGGSIAAVNAYSDMALEEVPHLFLEFQGNPASVNLDIERVQDIASDHGGGGFEFARKQEERNRLWAARHSAYTASQAQNPGKMAITTDICVPISKLSKAIEDTQADLEAHDMQGMLLGHVGDGNYHTALFYDAESSEGARLAKELAGRMAERALDLGGTVTGEHGVGMGKIKYMEAEHGDGWSVMADIKRALDPQNILNPGKIVQVN